MLKWWVYMIIGVFLLDFIYRTFYKQKINLNTLKTKNISQTSKENDLTLKNITKKKKNIKTNYDKKKFDPEIIHFYERQNSKKYPENIIKENDDEDDDDIVYPSNFNNQKKINEINEDDLEFEGLIPKPKKRINITIEYDDKYQDLYEELTKQLDGNITYLNFYPKIAEIDGNKKFLRYLLFFSMAICCLCFTFIEKIIEYCCSNIPQSLKSFLSVIKFFLSGGSYLFHMYFIRKITHSNIFEVYVDQKLKYSTFKRDEPPTYTILFNILKSIQNEE